MTGDEYAVWVMSHGALPSIVAARREQRPLAAAVAGYQADLERSHPANRPAIRALCHWLARYVPVASATHEPGACVKFSDS